MRVAVLVSMALMGCGRFNFDAVGDVAVDTFTAVDVPAPVGTGPWGTPVRVFSAPGPLDDVSLTSDGLELVVNRDDLVLTVTRQVSSEPWATPVVITELTNMPLTQPTVRGDGLELYASRFDAGRDAFVSVRSSRASAWGPLVSAADLDVFNSRDTAVRADGLEAIITQGAPNDDLNLVRRSSLTAPWKAFDPLDAVNSSGVDSEGCIAENGLALYFGSNRVDPKEDLFRSERPTLDDPFGPPVPISEINTGAEESDPWVSEDGRTLYFTSDRDGERQIWMATR